MPIARPPSDCRAGYGRQRFAQPFKAKHTRLLTRATVRAMLASASDTDDYLIEICKASRKGKPTTTALASVQVDNIANPPTG
jgi:hypothetical protein